ncbi:MAG: LamG domain-containing protein [Thermoleophilia bacterium]
MHITPAPTRPARRRLLVALIAAALAAAALPTLASATTDLRLLGYWPLNEGTGQVARDWSGNRNHGQLGSTAAADENDPTWIRGVFGRALRFAGGDFVTVPDSPVLEPAKVTVTAFVRGEGSPGLFRYIVSKGALGCTTGSYGLYTGFGGGLAFYVSNGDRFVVSPELDESIWDGRWHFVGGTYNGSTVRLFVDGRQIGTGSPADFGIGYGLPTSDVAEIGGYAGCDLTFRGDVDEVTIWNRALPLGS